MPILEQTAGTSETSENFCQTTRRNNPKDSHLHIRRRENLKSHRLGLMGLPVQSNNIQHLVSVV
jgi:hypothetical protein